MRDVFLEKLLESGEACCKSRNYLTDSDDFMLSQKFCAELEMPYSVSLF